MEHPEDLRISLTLEDFRKLVQGEVVIKNFPRTYVHLALQDVGYLELQAELYKAMKTAGSGICSPKTKT